MGYSSVISYLNGVFLLDCIIEGLFCSSAEECVSVRECIKDVFVLDSVSKDVFVLESVSKDVFVLDSVSKDVLG